jgi:hypothetical protein
MGREKLPFLTMVKMNNANNVFYLLGVQRDLFFVGTIADGLSHMKVM